MPDSCVLNEILQRGVLRVAARWDLTFEQFINPDTGEPDGVVGRVGRLMAGELGGSGRVRRPGVGGPTRCSRGRPGRPPDEATPTYPAGPFP